MKLRLIRVSGGVLSTVVVVAVLMLLMVMAVLALWDTDFLLFSRAGYLRMQRDNMESALAVYCNDPAVLDRLDADSTFLLYDSIPSSRMKLVRRPWGLYEVIGMESAGGKVRSSVVCGLREPSGDGCVLWYRNNNGAVTLTGRSYVNGRALLPDNGVIYGQMQSVFFSGERLHPNDIRKSGETMPEASAAARRQTEMLFGLRAGGVLHTDSIAVAFRAGEPLVLGIDGDPDGYHLSGNIILTGGEVTVGARTKLNDVIVVADKISVGDGFAGSCQLFARDSLFVGRNVSLEYPSGVYSRRYAELGDGSEVNGYFIVDYSGRPEVMQPNCRKSRLSKVRGL